jgi:diadenosine tetraphosphate (Ap4A) HIT family hydrolase
VGPAAGQSADHVHLHLLPRHDASTPGPRLRTVLSKSSAGDSTSE